MDIPASAVSNLRIGRSYDSKTNRAGIDIFQPEIITKTENVNQFSFRYKFIESKKDVRDLLNISGGISLKIKANILKVEGAGKYISDNKEDKGVSEILVVMKCTTVNKTMDGSASAKPEMMNSPSLGTHYVRSVTYGAEMVASLKFKSSSSSAKSNLKGKVDGGLDILRVVAPNAGLEAQLNKLTSNFNEASDLSIAYYATDIPDKNPTNLKDLVELIQEFPSRLKRLNEGLGVPIMIELQPIENEYPELKSVSSIQAMECDFDEMESRFDDLTEAQRLVSEYKKNGRAIHGEIKTFTSLITETLRKFRSAIFSFDKKRVEECLEAYRTALDGKDYEDKFVTYWKEMLPKKQREEVRQLTTPSSDDQEAELRQAAIPRGEEFEYQPERKRSQDSDAAQSGRAGESTRSRNAAQCKSTQRRNERDAPKLDSLSLANKPTARDPFSGATGRRKKKENKAFDTEKEGRSPRIGKSDPLSGTDAMRSDTFPNVSLRGHESLNTERGNSSQRMGKSDAFSGIEPLQSDTSANLSLRGHESLYTEIGSSSHRMGKSDPLSGTDRLQSNAFPNVSLRGHGSLNTERGNSSHRMGKSDAFSGIDPLQSDTSANLSLRGYESLYTEIGSSSHRMGKSDAFSGIDPLQSDTSANVSLRGYRSIYTEKEGSSRLIGESDPLRAIGPQQSVSFTKAALGGYAAHQSQLASTFQDLPLPKTFQSEEKDLSIIGWEASQESLRAMYGLIDSYSEVLNLITVPRVMNFDAHQMKIYFEYKPSKYCVLVADAEKIKAVLTQGGENILKLLQTADRNVAEKIILTICFSRCKPERDKAIVQSSIKAAFNDDKKVYVTWFENGKLVVNMDELVAFLTSSYYMANTSPREKSSVNDFNHRIYLGSGKTVLVITRLRNGRISLQPEDVEYWKPGFVVPREIVNDLAKYANDELVILSDEHGSLTCQVNEKKGKEWQNFTFLEPDETIMLETKLKHGQIFHQFKHLVPQGLRDQLKEIYGKTAAADVCITSNSKGNFLCHVKAGSASQVLTFINPNCNKAAGKKVHLI